MTEKSVKNPDLAGTWPLFDEGQPGNFPADPKHALSSSSPGDQELAALDRHDEFHDTPDSRRKNTRRARESLPPLSPEWMRAARALADWLEERVQSGSVDAVEQAAIARTWAAWSMSGASEAHILRVAHLVGRAHGAIRERHVKTSSCKRLITLAPAFYTVVCPPGFESACHSSERCTWCASFTTKWIIGRRSSTERPNSSAGRTTLECTLLPYYAR